MHMLGPPSLSEVHFDSGAVRRAQIPAVNAEEHEQFRIHFENKWLK